METLHVWNDGFILWNCRINGNRIEYRYSGTWETVIGIAYRVTERESDGMPIVDYSRKLQS